MRTQLFLIRHPVLVTITVISALSVIATNADERRRQGPPQAAIDVCENAAENDSCSFEGHQGTTLNGLCGMPPRRSELVCIPEGHKFGKHRKNEGDMQSQDEGETSS